MKAIPCLVLPAIMIPKWEANGPIAFELLNLIELAAERR